MSPRRDTPPAAPAATPRVTMPSTFASRAADHAEREADVRQPNPNRVIAGRSFTMPARVPVAERPSGPAIFVVRRRRA